MTYSNVMPLLDMVEKKVDGVRMLVVAPTAKNFLTIMRNDDYFSSIKFNVLRGVPEKHENNEKALWTDTDDAAARTYLEATYHISSRQKSDDAFAQFQHDREYNPVTTLIDGIVWDGEPRVEKFLIKWLGAEDTPYNRECSRLLFAGGVHRAYAPGCKVDTVIVLIGKQGGGKSTVCQWLALDADLYSSVKTIRGQKGAESVAGKWICEIEELLATIANEYGGGKSDELCKAFISTQNDFYRKPYDRRPTDNPRSCVFIGTTNRSEFLTDKTGNRRWYPVNCHQDAAYLYDHEIECKSDIAQCWAEMKAAYTANNPFSDPVSRCELLTEIKGEQTAAEQDDWREGVIARYISAKRSVCLIEIWQNALYANRAPHYPIMRRKDGNELVAILTSKCGWERAGVENFGTYGKQKAYHRPISSDEIDKLTFDLPE